MAPPARNKPSSSTFSGLISNLLWGSTSEPITKHLESTSQAVAKYNASDSQEKSEEIEDFVNLYLDTFAKRSDWTEADVMDTTCVLALRPTNEPIQSTVSRWLESMCRKVVDEEREEAHAYIKAIGIALIMLETKHIMEYNEKLIKVASGHLERLEKKVNDAKARPLEGKAVTKMSRDLLVLSCILLMIRWESDSESEKQSAGEVMERFDALLAKISTGDFSPLLAYKSTFIANVSNFVSKGPQGYRKLYLPKTVMREPVFPLVNFLELQRSSRRLINDPRNELETRYASPHFYRVDSPIEWIKDLDALEFDVRLAESRCQTSMSETFVEDLFGNGEVLQSMNNVMVFGDPGSGKTSLARKLAYQWADGKWGTGFSMVYYVHLDSFQYSQVNIGGCEIGKVLAEAIALWCYHPVVTNEDFDRITAGDRNGGQDYLSELREKILEQLSRKSTLLIVDSDNWACLDRQDIPRFIVNSQLGHKLMLFCRKSELNGLKPNFDAQIECRGVTDDYIRKSAAEKPRTHPLWKLIDCRREFRDIWALVHKPRHLVSLVAYWDGVHKPVDETDNTCGACKGEELDESAMYREMAAGLLNSYLSRHPELNEEREPVLEALEEVAIRSLSLGAPALIKSGLIEQLIPSRDKRVIVIRAGLMVKVKDGSDYSFASRGFYDYFVGRAMARALSPSLNSIDAGGVHGRYQRILDAANQNSDGFPIDDWMDLLTRFFYKTMDSHSYSQLYFQWLGALRYKYLALELSRKKLRCEISEQLTILAVSGTTKGVRDKALKTLCDIGWECRATGGWGADAAVLEAVLNDLYYLHRRATTDNRAATRAAITELLQNESKEAAGLRKRFLNGASLEEKLSEQKRVQEMSEPSDIFRTTISDYEIKESQRKKGSIGLTESLTNYYLSLRPTFPCDFNLPVKNVDGESEASEGTRIFDSDEDFDTVGLGDRLSKLWAQGEWGKEFQILFWIRDRDLTMEAEPTKTLARALAASFTFAATEDRDYLETKIETELQKSSTLVIIDTRQPNFGIVKDLINTNRQYTLYLLGAESANIERAVIREVVREPSGEHTVNQTNKGGCCESSMSHGTAGRSDADISSPLDQSTSNSANLSKIRCKFMDSTEKKVFDIDSFHVDLNQVVGRFFYDVICEKDTPYKRSDFAIYKVRPTPTEIKQVSLSKTFQENGFNDQYILIIRSGQDYIYATEETVQWEWKTFNHEKQTKNEKRSWFQKLFSLFYTDHSNRNPAPAEEEIVRLEPVTGQSKFLNAEDKNRSNCHITISVEEIVDDEVDKSLHLRKCRKAQRKLNRELKSTSEFLLNCQSEYRLNVQLIHNSANTPKIDIKGIRIRSGENTVVVPMELKPGGNSGRRDVSAFSKIDGGVMRELGLTEDGCQEWELTVEIDLQAAGLKGKTIEGHIKAVTTRSDVQPLVGQNLQPSASVLNSSQAEITSVDTYCILLYIDSDPRSGRTDLRRSVSIRRSST